MRRNVTGGGDVLGLARGLCLLEFFETERGRRVRGSAAEMHGHVCASYLEGIIPKLSCAGGGRARVWGSGRSDLVLSPGRVRSAALPGRWGGRGKQQLLRQRGGGKVCPPPPPASLLYSADCPARASRQTPLCEGSEAAGGCWGEAQEEEQGSELGPAELQGGGGGGLVPSSKVLEVY